MRSGISTGEKRASANSYELADCRVASDDDPVFDDDMSTQAGARGDGDVITELTVMAHMGIGHEIVFVADSGWFVRLASMGGEAFSEGIFITDDQSRLRVRGIESKILRRPPEPCTGVEHIAMADFRFSLDPVLPHQPCA